MTSRGWIFTLHNPTEENIEFGRRWLETPECIGISAGREICPKTGRPHLQGYVRLNKSVRKGHFRKIWYKCPPTSEQGCRSDLVEFREAIKRNADDAELFEKHLPILAKYPRLEHRLKESFLKSSTREFRNVQVIVHWGDAGTGKTRKPYEEGAYLFDDYENGWWDGYAGESVICLDDFYGGIKYAFLLRLLDGYQCRLKIKGGFTYAQWSKVYITSNKPPTEWYSLGLTPALSRRITEVVHFN